MRKQAFLIDMRKQSYCTADLRPFVFTKLVHSLFPFSESVQASLCQTWSKTSKTGFLAPQFMCVASCRNLSDYLEKHCIGEDTDLVKVLPCRMISYLLRRP